MTRGIGILDRVVISVGIAVVALGVGGVGDDGIGRDEPVNIRTVIPGIHVDQAQVVVMFVAGVAPVGNCLAWQCAPRSWGIVNVRFPALGLIPYQGEKVAEPSQGRLVVVCRIMKINCNLLLFFPSRLFSYLL